MKQENKSKKAKYLVLLILCVVIVLGCIVWLVVYFLGLEQAGNQMQEIRDTYLQEDGVQRTKEPPEESTVKEDKAPESVSLSPAPTEPPAETALTSLENYDVPEKDIDFAGLREEQNEDIYAWITIPDTKIDYPVLQHPEEMDYYLDRNLDGSRGYPGCIYTQLINSKEWTDSNTVIYGHNMKNGTMFANLHYYGDSKFFEEHQYVYLYTEEKTYVYQIFAAYEYSDVHLLLGIDIGTPEKYQDYLGSIFDNDGFNNHFNTNIELTSDSRIITLSTCISGKSEKRWLVQAVLVAEGSV